MRNIFLSLLLLTGTSVLLSAQTPANDNSSNTVVKWYTMTEAIRLNEKAPRKLFIDLYTDWCGWCKTLDKKTFSDPAVAAYLNANYYPVKFNPETTKEAITFGGNTFHYNPQYRAHELAIALMQGKMSYPSMAYINEGMQLLSTVPGYQGPEDILPLLVYFAKDYYKTIGWEDFQKQWPQLKKSSL